jgi:hypothetical protein
MPDTRDAPHRLTQKKMKRMKKMKKMKKMTKNRCFHVAKLQDGLCSRRG